MKQTATISKFKFLSQYQHNNLPADSPSETILVIFYYNEPSLYKYSLKTQHFNYSSFIYL
jgi:hypothetical protein